MDHKGEDSERYYSILDNFASEVGSTLEDLATHWEDNQNYKDNERSSSTLSTESGNSIDDFGKKFAKPLFFYNPVYSMVYQDTAQKQAKRPTLIPLDQLNGNNKHTEEDTRHTKGSGGKHSKKKNPHRTHGIFSKISAAARRHSHSNPVDDNSLNEESTSSSRKSSQASTHEINQSDLNAEKPEKSPPDHMSSSPPYTESNATRSVENHTVSSIKKSHKIPPVKSPRNSRILADKDVWNITGRSAAEPQVAQPVPVPRNSNTTYQTAIQEQAEDESQISKDTNPRLESEPSVVAETVPADPRSSIQAKNFGSTNSVDSQLSCDSFPSDAEGKTMADVIAEVSLGEVSDDSSVPTETQNKAEKELSAVPGQLKRNKTLRWTGTRKANALVREFTLKHKQTDVVSSSDVDSPCKEVEALTRTPKVQRRLKPVYTDSRSCTPSQQTTSFDMEDEDDVMEGMPNDADISSSENSDGLSTTFTDARPPTIKPVAKSPSKRDSYIVLSSLLPPAPKLRRTQSSKVRAYLQKLGTNVNNALGYAVTQFLEQTLKNEEKRPLVLLHDVRSFLTDIKIYLISNPHIGLAKKIQKIINRSSLADVDGAVDDALDRLVLYPLHDMVYRCLVMDYSKSGKLDMMQDAIALAKKKSPKELGIRDSLIPPDAAALEVIKGHFVQLQRTYSPYFKLKELLGAVTKIYQSTKDLNTDDHSARKIGADDFLPLLVYALVQCDFIAADIETQYIDGLLDPSLLLGEGGYYLTTLISAIQVVVSIKRKEAALPNISDLQGFLKVGISPSEPKLNKSEAKGASGEIVMHKTLHVPPAMTSRNLCQMIAKRFKVSLPEDYSLHVVVNGEAHALEPNECPQLVKMDLLTQFPASAFYFCFQRRSASPKATADSTNQSTNLLNLNSDAEKTSLHSNSDTTSGTSTEKETEFCTDKDLEYRYMKSLNEDNVNVENYSAEVKNDRTEKEQYLDATNPTESHVSEENVVPEMTVILSEDYSIDQENLERRQDNITNHSGDNVDEEANSQEVEDVEFTVKESNLPDMHSVKDGALTGMHCSVDDDDLPEVLLSVADGNLQEVHSVEDSDPPDELLSRESPPVKDGDQQVLKDAEKYSAGNLLQKQQFTEDAKASNLSMNLEIEDRDEESQGTSVSDDDIHSSSRDGQSSEDELAAMNNTTVIQTHEKSTKTSDNSESATERHVSNVTSEPSVPAITFRYIGPERSSIRSSRSSSRGSGKSDRSVEEDLLKLGIRRTNKRKSCMAKENVATLKEYFETKTSPKSPQL